MRNLPGSPETFNIWKVIPPRANQRVRFLQSSRNHEMKKVEANFKIGVICHGFGQSVDSLLQLPQAEYASNIWTTNIQGRSGVGIYQLFSEMKWCTFALPVTKFALFPLKLPPQIWGGEEDADGRRVRGEKREVGDRAVGNGCPVSPTNLLLILLNTHQLGVSL